MLAAATFAVFARGVMCHGWMADQDAMMSRWIIQIRTPFMTQIWSGFTHVHSTLGILSLSALFAAYLIWKNRARWLSLWLAVVPLGMGSNVVLKEFFQRSRPALEGALVSVTSFSFPSGHTTGATLFYGVVAACIWRGNGSAAVHVVSLAVLTGLIALVAFSRIYLGVHYLSDVLASMVLASAWIASGLAVDRWLSRGAASLDAVLIGRRR